MKRWLCDYADCFNQNHHCWQPQDEDHQHYKLFNNHIIRWNKAIIKHDVIVEYPPFDLKERLFTYADISRKKKLNAAAKGADASNASNAAAVIQTPKSASLTDQETSLF